MVRAAKEGHKIFMEAKNAGKLKDIEEEDKQEQADLLKEKQTQELIEKQHELAKRTQFYQKLIKKLGQQLLEDPVIGENFIQPLKSQGVIEMQDSAMIIRVKFMTKPGDQWLVRKKVYEEAMQWK